MALYWARCTRGDVLLRRLEDAKEALAPMWFECNEPLSKDALMKVFVNKPRVEPLLRFNIRAVT